MPQGAAVKIRGDTRDIARGAASDALLISSGPPSTRGAREPTLGGGRARPGACSSYAGLRAHACLHLRSPQELSLSPHWKEAPRCYLRLETESTLR